MLLNTSSNTVFVIFERLFLLVTYSFLIRLLDLEDYGLLIIGITLYNQLSLLDGGSATALEKYIPENRIKKHSDISLLSTAVTVIFFLIGILSSILFYFLAKSGLYDVFNIRQGTNAAGVFYSLSLISLIYWPGESLKSACRAHNLHHELNIINFARNLGSAVLIIIAAYLGAPVFLLIICWYIPYLIALVPTYILLGKYQKVFVKAEFNTIISTFRYIYNFSVWVFIIQLSSRVLNSLDKLFVSIIAGVEAVPIYYGLMRVIKIPIDVNSIMKSALVPVASEVAATYDKKRFNELIMQGAKSFNAVYGIVSLFTVIFADEILRILGGSELSKFDNIVMLGIALLLIPATRSFLNTVLIGSGEVIRQQAFFSMLTLIIYLPIFIAGLYYYNIEGGILSYALTHIILMVPWLYLVLDKAGLTISEYTRMIIQATWPASYYGMQNILLIAFMKLFTLLTVTVATWSFCVDSSIKKKIISFLYAMSK